MSKFKSDKSPSELFARAGREPDLDDGEGLAAGWGRAAAPPDARLELKDYKWKQGEGSYGRNLEETIAVHTDRCRARTCPVCGKRRGWETRQALLSPSRLALFSRPVLLTLTIDPKHFEGPEAAHRVVTTGGYIRRLLRLLGIKNWVWVLEFHESGWPHWHIMADVSERGRLTPEDLKQCWHLWRDKWGLGGLDVQARKQFATAAHAVNYITKYLMKPPRVGFPLWFLQGKRRRLVQASQSVGRLCFKGSEGNGDAVTKKKRSASRPLLERMKDCGKSSTLIMSRLNRETGEVLMDYLGKLPLGAGEVIKLAEAGAVPAEFGVRRQIVQFLGGFFQRVVIEGPDVREKAGKLSQWARAGKLGEPYM